MHINLFVKEKGLEYLQAVYHLSDQQICDLRESLYNHTKQEKISEEEANKQIEMMWNWLPEEEKQKIKNSLISSSWPEWQIVDDALERFLVMTGIKLDEHDLSDLCFQCIHVSPAIDGGESIKKSGVRKLTDLVDNESPIKTFLADYGIEINAAQRWYSVNGQRFSIKGSKLEIKLYSTKSEIEAFIAGELETLKDYSCLEYNPEFLRELSSLVGIDLQAEWKKKKNSLLYVGFDVSFNECANITDMSCLNTPDNYERILPYLNGTYPYGEEPTKIWQNHWFIKACIENGCPEKHIDRSPMAVKEDVELGPERIIILSSM